MLPTDKVSSNRLDNLVAEGIDKVRAKRVVIRLID